MSTDPDFNQLHDDLFERGLRNRREVVGDAYVNAALQNGSSEFAYPGQQLVTEYDCLRLFIPVIRLPLTPGTDGAGGMSGHVLVSTANSGASSVSWSTHVMDVIMNDTNVYLDIGMLIALKSWPELGIHVRGALNNGLTETEIREAVLHATIYCGVPAGVEAMKVAEKTINGMIANGEHKRQLAEFSPAAKGKQG